MRRRKKQNSWITLSVSVGAIVLFGLVSVFLVWISGNTGDAFSGKWDDYDVILDENCAPGALEGECDRTQVEYGSLRYRLNTAPWFADSSTSGTVCFQNDGGNQHFVRISYRLGDEEVYRTVISTAPAWTKNCLQEIMMECAKSNCSTWIHWSYLERWRKKSPLRYRSKKSCEIYTYLV